MPKSFLKGFLIFSLVSLCHLVAITTTYAATDPQIATTSATATVPYITPTTGDTVAPTAPILIRPVDNTITGDNKPEFVWRQSSDPNGNYVIYTLYLNGVATYLGISNVGNSAGTGYSARLDIDELKLVPTIAIPDGTYDWYVTASDLSGNTSRSATWHLTIDTTPPFIAVTDIDIYHGLQLDSDHPENFTDLNFDIPGPKDVYFTIHTEPWATITLQFYDTDGQLVSQTNYPYQHLAVGRYSVAISSVDRAGNTTALPYIGLTITQAHITIPAIPGITTPIDISYTPYSVPTLPATIAKLTTSYSLALLIYLLLALLLILLIIFFWRRRYNLVLLDAHLKPIKDAIIYHSIPNQRSRYSPLYLTSRPPIIYDLLSGHRGRLYIAHLTRYSTLTIRQEERLYILSLSTNSRLYTIVLA